MLIRLAAVWLVGVVGTSLLLQLFGLVPWYSPNRDVELFNWIVFIASTALTVAAYFVMKERK